ncbi:MAG: ABC transporter ATP-binding protein [Planctomycetota bacterium]|nr:ABC transporter ATP-binding protein [Planctomycetota bacterium]
MPTLKVNNITKEFPTRADPLRVLSGISLEISSGQNLAIVGPSGSGKSTLLHILGTLEQPTSGSLTLDGEDPFQLDEPRLADFRNRRIGFVFQDHHLLSQCTVLENTLLPALAQGSTSRQQVDYARDLLQRAGLADRIDHRPAELSGGERQRVAVARALINRPTLLLADEPTGNLDRTTAASIAELLLELQRSDQTILIVVTHSLDLAGRMDQARELDDGLLHESQPLRD